MILLTFSMLSGSLFYNKGKKNIMKIIITPEQKKINTQSASIYNERKKKMIYQIKQKLRYLIVVYSDPEHNFLIKNYSPYS